MRLYTNLVKQYFYYRIKKLFSVIDASMDETQNSQRPLMFGSGACINN